MHAGGIPVNYKYYYIKSLVEVNIDNKYIVLKDNNKGLCYVPSMFWINPYEGRAESLMVLT